MNLETPAPFHLGVQEILKLPLGQYEGRITVVDKPGQVEKGLARLRGERILGFDTETRPNFKKGRSNAIALLQLASQNETLLIRLPQTGMPDCLRALLEDPAVLKIGQEVVDEILKLHETYGVRLTGALNLGVLARAMDCRPLSVKGLTALFLGFRISKASQTSNWENPVLTEKQIRYAATDAWVCRGIYLEMKRRGFPKGIDARIPDDIIEQRLARALEKKTRRRPRRTLTE